MKRLLLVFVALIWASCSYAQIPNVKMQSQCIGNDANTMLLVHFDGVNASTTIPDSSLVARGNATVNGTAQITTAASKFGSGSVSLGAAGNYLTFPSSAAWQLGTSDFTVDYWAQVQAGDGTAVWSQAAGNPVGWIAATRTTDIGFSGGGTGTPYALVRVSTISLSTSTWYHVAFVRSGSNWFNFVNGVSQSFSTNTGVATGNLGPATAQLLNIGGQSFSSVALMDELRISNVPRWTANFSPPSQPYCP